MRRNGLVLLAYAATSFAWFGWRLLPHPGRPLLGSGMDPEIPVLTITDLGIVRVAEEHQRMPARTLRVPDAEGEHTRL